MNSIMIAPPRLTDEHLAHSEATSAPSRIARVLHVLPELYPGGMERAMVRIIGAIGRKDADPAGQRFEHSFCILKLAHDAMLRQCETLGRVHVLGHLNPCSSHRSAVRFVFRDLARLILRERPDVIHARSTSAWLDAALAVKRCSLHHQPRLLLSFHGRTSIAPESMWQTLRGTPKRWAARQADAVMALSHEIAEMLEDRWRVPQEHIHVLPNGVDVQTYHPPQSPEAKRLLRARLGIPESARVILCVANLVPIKNHELLLNAFRDVALAQPEAHLYLLGQGPCEPALRYLARAPRDRGHHQCVHFLGNRTDVAQWLRAADIFALPSLSEGCSNAVLEAMATGLPVVASDIPGNREIILHDANGALLPVQDARAWARRINGWLDRPDEAKQIGLAARTHVMKHHALQRTAERYARFYAALASPSFGREVRSCVE